MGHIFLIMCRNLSKTDKVICQFFFGKTTFFMFFEKSFETINFIFFMSVFFFLQGLFGIIVKTEETKISNKNKIVNDLKLQLLRNIPKFLHANYIFLKIQTHFHILSLVVAPSSSSSSSPILIPTSTKLSSATSMPSPTKIPILKLGFIRLIHGIVLPTSGANAINPLMLSMKLSKTGAGSDGGGSSSNSRIQVEFNVSFGTIC